jgi:hypothetical protein
MRPGDHDGGHPHDSSRLTWTAVDDLTCRLQDGPSRPGVIIASKMTQPSSPGPLLVTRAIRQCHLA